MALMLGGRLCPVSFCPDLSRGPTEAPRVPVQTSGAEADTTTPVAHTRTCVTQPSHQYSTETSDSAEQKE